MVPATSSPARRAGHADSASAISLACFRKECLDKFSALAYGHSASTSGVALRRNVVQRQAAWQIPQANREQRRRQVPGQARAQVERGRWGAPDVDLTGGLVERLARSEGS